MTTADTKDQWLSVQKKTFTKWMNNRLEKSGFKGIYDLIEDSRDGVALINLINSITGIQLKHNSVAATRYKKSENFEYLIKFLSENGVPIVNIGPYDLVDGNEKLVLGFVWIIILRFGLTGISDENQNAKKSLLTWCRKVTEDYDNVDITDFSKSWKDGLAFNAIIHRFRPDLIEYDSLNKEKHLFNISNAFDVAESKLDISKLLEAEDITEAIKPDEKSIFTYVSQYYNYFNTQEKQNAAKKRLSDLIRSLNWSLKVRNEYEARAAEFLAMKKGFQDDKSEFKTITNAFITKMIKRKEMAYILNCMFLDLKSLYGNIAMTNKAYNMKVYSPPEDLKIENLDEGAYGNEISEFEEFKVLKEIVKNVFSVGYELKIKRIEKIKKLFNLRVEIDEQIGELRKEVVDTQEISDLISCEEIIYKKIEHLNSVKSMINQEKDLVGKSTELFNKFDTGKDGNILMKDLLTCLKILNCKIPGKFETEDMNSKVSYDEFLLITKNIIYSAFSKTQVVTDIEEIQLNKVDVSVLELDLVDCDMVISKEDGLVNIEKILKELNI